MNSDETTRNNDVVGVVGLGGLGRGIVACCLARGFTVVGIDREQSNRQRLSVYLPEARAQCVEAGVIDADDPSDWQARTAPFSTVVKRASSSGRLSIQASPRSGPSTHAAEAHASAVVASGATTLTVTRWTRPRPVAGSMRCE